MKAGAWCRMDRMVLAGQFAGTLMIVSCGLTPSAAPVPVEGSDEEVSELAGEWDGRYWSKATGRHGIITFTMPEHADTGYGQVEITFSPALRLSRDAAAADGVKPDPGDVLEPEPCASLSIKLVRISEGKVQGTLAPYWDPDCDCRAQTVFDGTISGNRITGTFSSRRESNDRRIVSGQWQVERKQS